MTDVEVLPYRGAVSQIGSGALTAAKGSLRLALLLSGSGFGLLGRAAVMPVQRGLARRSGSQPKAQVVEVTPKLGPVGRLRSTAVRIGLAGVVVGGLAAGAAVFAKARARKRMPQPAATPPAVRTSTNGTGNLVSYVDHGSTPEN